MWLFLAFLTVPLIEIGLFITVGEAIGLWPTLGIVILTAVIGTALVRSQGAMALNNLRGSFNQLNDPTEHLAHGAMIIFSGALLLTPGFFTDAVGFALLVPPVRSFIFQELRKRIKVQSFMSESQHRTQSTAQTGEVIDETGEIIDPPRNGPSGWTRH